MLVVSTAALIVPDKSIALLRSDTSRPADTQLVARAPPPSAVHGPDSAASR